MRTLKEIVDERRRIWIDNDMWTDGLDMIVSELIQDHFMGDYRNVISFLDSLSEEDFDMFTQFYEDFIREFHSQELLDYMYISVRKYPNLDIEKDVEWAQKEFSDNEN